MNLLRGLLCIVFLIAAPIPAAAMGNPLDLIARPKAQKLETWLDRQLEEWKPEKCAPMLFGAYDVYASDDVMSPKVPPAIDKVLLDSLMEASPDVIVLYIRPKTYFSMKARYDALIDGIRQDGKKLFIGARFTDEPKDFGTYEDALTEYARNIIAAIKPDYFGIVIEPRTMEKQFGFKATDEQWVKLHDKIATLSKQLSPGTKTVAGGHAGELGFLRLVSDVKNLDIVGFDIYSNQGLDPEYSGYLGKGDVIGKTIDFVNAKGKETWILETWTAAMVSKVEQYMSVKEYMKPVDAKWVRAMGYYAQRHNMKAVVPFFTGKFFYYGRDPAELRAALERKDRTSAFHEFKSMTGAAQCRTPGG
ncbi:MAG: hypothetical protein V1721_00235 [Pseudomonadota bacterium]